jgi:DNA-binding XRE family transcriptional regulator
MDISALIAATGKTHTQIASEAGLSRQTVWNIETGRTTPKVEVAFKLAKALGCNVADIRPDIADMIS